jgi:hypothetical protein
MDECRRHFEEFINSELPDEIIFLAAELAVGKGNGDYYSRKLEAYGFIAGFRAAWGRPVLSVEEIARLVVGNSYGGFSREGTAVMNIAQAIHSAMGGKHEANS